MYTLITPPAAALLDMTTVKAHLRVDADDNSYDTLLTAYMSAAQQLVEKEIGRALLAQTWQFTCGRLAHARSIANLLCLELDGGPNLTPTKVEILVSGVYQDVTASSVARAITDSYTRVLPAAGQTWPSADLDDAAYRVTYTCGYGASAANVPSPIFVAALLVMGDLFANRGTKVPANLIENAAAKALLSPYMAPGL